ncbi:MAG: heparinase II/III family protein [Clostridia bacterium]|nr:heparinase II/III family protein [Clostridia bacterium]
MEKKNYISSYNDKKWDEVRSHPYFAKVREGALSLGEELLATEPLPIRFSDMHKFEAEGVRGPYTSRTDPYFRRLSVFYFCYMLTKEEKYLTALADVIWQICDFETWATNAHVKEALSLHDRKGYLELVSCSVGFRIAEILYYIGDDLPELVARRARAELRTRIIDAFKEKTGEKDFNWYTKTNNWSAVCAALVLGCFLYAAEKDEIDAAIPRLIRITDYFVSGMEEDGCCLEGYGYWVYGYSHYCLFAHMLMEYTDGRINLFENKKVREAAFFQTRIALNDHQCVSFSDGGTKYNPCLWLAHFLKGVYPDLPVPEREPPAYTPGFCNQVLWLDPYMKGEPLAPESHIFSDAQWFIHIGESYSVGAKAGKNSEPHNHNDIGSFIISKDNNITFSDPGGGEYVKTYFGAGRYTHLVTSARGHSVPVINGHIQCWGEEKARLLVTEADRFAFTCEHAYPSECRETLESFVRDIRCLKDAMILTDSFSFTEEPTSLVEQFVSLTPIEGENGSITCGASRLTYDADLFDMELTSESFRRNSGKEETLYILKLSARKLDRELSFAFRFD